MSYKRYHDPRPMICSNCSGEGHFFRDCKYPITSYGIVAMRFTDASANPSLQNTLASLAQHLIPGRQPVEFLLICRRDSLSFIEFVRGKYSTIDRDYLHALFVNMTQAEHAKIRALTFEQLWSSVWGAAADTHKTDFENSHRKYKQLGDIGTLLTAYPTPFLEPEWGFPKGRRNSTETELLGAVREFKEETNLKESQFRIFQNVEPLVESFKGSNNVNYCHKYFLAMCPTITPVAMDATNPHMHQEIGNIGWFSYEGALEKIRPRDREKRIILEKASQALKNFVPL
jgi:8-oxo-dGTP pyrophosphatase MutT (NUDIX family)